MNSASDYAKLLLLIEGLKRDGFKIDIYPARMPKALGWSNDRLGLNSVKLGLPFVEEEMQAWQSCCAYCLDKGLLKATP